MLKTELEYFTQLVNTRNFSGFNRRIHELNNKESSDKHRIIADVLITAIDNKDVEYFEWVLSKIFVFRQDKTFLNKIPVVQKIVEALIETDIPLSARMLSKYINIFGEFINWNEAIKKSIEHHNYEILKILLSEKPYYDNNKYLTLAKEQNDTQAYEIISGQSEKQEKYNTPKKFPYGAPKKLPLSTPKKLTHNFPPVGTLTQQGLSNIHMSNFITSIKPNLVYGETDSFINNENSSEDSPSDYGSEDTSD
jgi:hypothetical protein